jgi:DNA-binding CsgD family transcriptional regulator
VRQETRVYAALGLSPDEERAYRFLVERGAVSESTLGRTLGLGRHRTSSVVASLLDMGLVTRDAGGPRPIRAIAPNIGLAALISSREAALRRVEQAIPDLMSAFGRSIDAVPTQLVEVVEGQERQQQRWKQMQRSAQREVAVFDTPPYVTDADEGNPIEEDLLLQKGVRYRSLYARAALEFPGGLDLARQLVALGERARVVREVPLKMGLVDDRFAIVPLWAEGQRMDTALVVHPCSLLWALRALFEQLWEEGTPLRFGHDGDQGDDWAGRDPDLPPDERELLSFAVSGLTDNAMARHLGVSRRTVERRLRRIMERVGASSRAQLGLLAARRGWL